MTRWAADGEEARADRIARIAAIVIVAAFIVIGGSVHSSSTHARLRPPKARCDTRGGAAPDRCRSRPPGDGPAPARAAPRSGTEPSPAPDPNPEGPWLDTAGLVVAFAVGAVCAVVRWREARALGVRREHRARFFRAA